ncbi:hypothetical protein F4781DRAFT_421770 [Annulohypoxylon bovei var. microspora]|nr:hypothetical protein F4781DRAFT_421770 [Annulohypoxylon bovei var. microspora]
MEAVSTSFSSRRTATHALPQFHLPTPTSLLDIGVTSMHHPIYFDPNSSPSSDDDDDDDNGYSPNHPSPSSPPPNSPIEPDEEESQDHFLSPEPYFDDCNLLTGSLGVPSSETQSPSPGVYSGNSLNSSPAGQLYSPQNNNWASLPVSTPYTQNLMTQGALMQSNYGRSSIYSPAGPAYPRSSQSPADGLPPPPFESGSPAFPLPIPGGGVSHSNLLSHSSNQHSLQNPMMNNSHTQGSHPPTPSTTAAPDSYARPQQSSSYYSAPSSSTPHQSPFPSFTSTHTSPPQASPTTAGGLPRNLPAHHSPMQAPHYQGQQYTYPGGPVLTNMTNPGGQMRIVGPMHMSGHQYNSQGQMMNAHHMYSGQSSQQQNRPYKCDVCPQQFNRNHDLKRHKRIHLAIKPFPCTFCEKSFSRKDALKRHRMVKGCGNGKDSPDDGNDKSLLDDTNPGLDGRSSPRSLVKEEPS